MSDELPSTPLRAGRARFSPRLVLFAVILVLGTAIIALSLLGPANSPLIAQPDALGAQIACRTFVTERLKAPGTATFDTPERTELGEGRFRITGNVEAQNAAGAPLRTGYTCTVRGTGGDDYTLEDLGIQAP